MFKTIADVRNDRLSKQVAKQPLHYDQPIEEQAAGPRMLSWALLVSLFFWLGIFLLVRSCHGQELPEAPAAVSDLGTGGVSFVAAPIHRPTFTRLDWSLVGAEWAARAGDYITTMDCQHQTKTDTVETHSRLRYTVTVHTCSEYELPQAFVAGRAQFAAYSFGIAALQTFGQWELTKHGHRTAARRLALVSVGYTVEADIQNKATQ
ncbi:MAG: hypothetical protein WBQ94_03590 [Terracidiphilus sp.]